MAAHHAVHHVDDDEADLSAAVAHEQREEQDLTVRGRGARFTLEKVRKGVQLRSLNGGYNGCRYFKHLGDAAAERTGRQEEERCARSRAKGRSSAGGACR